MAGSNGLTRLAVLLLMHGSSNDSKPSNKWTTLGSYMTWLFAFSIVGTIIIYCMLDDKAALKSEINKAILSGLEIVEEKKTQESIETSCLTDVVIDQIEKEISNNENKSYFRINK